MWSSSREKQEETPPSLVAVAIDKDKASQFALKWALDNLLSRGQTVILLHVTNKVHSIQNQDANQQSEVGKEIFLPFRCFCTRKDVQCKDVILEETEIAKAIIEYLSQNSIEIVVLGASSRNAIVKRFKGVDVPTNVSKGAPDFCCVNIISKGKVISQRSATRPAPSVSPLRAQINNQGSIRNDIPQTRSPSTPKGRVSNEQCSAPEELDVIKSPFSRGSRGLNIRPYGDASLSDTDISFVSSNRPSTERTVPPTRYNHYEVARPNKLSELNNMDNRSFESTSSTLKPMILTPFVMNDYQSSYSNDSGTESYSSQTTDDVEAEMRRLRQELKQTMDLYSAACKDALNSKQKARELHSWKMEEEMRIGEARLAEGNAIAMAEMEKAKCRVAMEAAQASQRIAELEAKKRVSAERKALEEAEEKKRALDALAHSDGRYRRYSIQEIEEATEFFADNRKIGEGGYGPVYRSELDHTPVAIKVLRPDAAQGRSQFQQEVEVLSSIRHPNMVLLLGACPEYGCLVYEYMANGSLEDRLFRRGNSPPLSWQIRFRIAAEIATGLLFLHQTKPEPLVHRDLKPGNILLDRNYVSKISDVGLARLVPPSVANTVTQYLMTSTAGTFCYIDPEYQQTGMLGVKSDVYSLGIMFLQLITARPPMGLTHHVERAIEKGVFQEMLDPVVRDWPVAEALKFAKLSLDCAELRRKDRPDLGKVVVPELNRLRELAEENMPNFYMGPGHGPSPHNYFSYNQDVMSHDHMPSACEISRSSMSSGLTGRRSSIIA